MNASRNGWTHSRTNAIAYTSNSRLLSRNYLHTSRLPQTRPILLCLVHTSCIKLDSDTISELRSLLADHSLEQPVHWLSIDRDEELGEPTYRLVTFADRNATESQIATFEPYGDWVKWNQWCERFGQLSVRDRRATSQARVFPAHSGVRLAEVLGVRLRRRVAAVLEQRRTVSQPVRGAARLSLESVGGSWIGGSASQPIRRRPGRPSKGKRGPRTRVRPQRALLASRASA
ncbi:DUF2332 family protein [Natronococcus roseus]|uniref:DUF2332 family protein n=1 Tax=Natronococcus roseus TaxID=1052014 RepID=UPI00374CB5C7